MRKGLFIFLACPRAEMATPASRCRDGERETMTLLATHLKGDAVRNVRQKRPYHVFELIIIALLICGSAGSARARSLKRQVDGLFGSQGISISRVEIPNAQGQAVLHAAHLL